MSNERPGMCAHHRPDLLPYLAGHADAERRMANGEHQTQCSACKYWLWDHEVGTRSPSVLVCGGRAFSDRAMVFSALDNIHWHRSTIGIERIINGGAGGADGLAREWAKARDVECVTVRADWKTHGRKAGPMRNAEMLTLGPDIVVAFPGGRGTEDMIRQAKAAGVKEILMAVLTTPTAAQEG